MVLIIKDLLCIAFSLTIGIGFLRVYISLYLIRKLIKTHFNSIYKKLEPYQLKNPDWSYKYWLLLGYSIDLEQKLKKHDPVYKQLSESDVAAMRKYNRYSNSGAKLSIIGIVLLYVGQLIFGKHFLS
ncbi:MAG: hypothetical protein A3F41_05405 [Coxiella sp. RIFCSPHIGHO2_12_FULL_44_14]|nr:MAG: hypothetical protein A3F41_05405 [Coxiella sp. RIFCSPHIGHO2_12_FULL_44_14]